MSFIPPNSQWTSTHDKVSDGRDFANFGGEFHADHSFEVNPPSYTMLRLVRTPKSGGDTIWTSQTALFDKLSLPLQRLVEGLHAVHSSEVCITKGNNPSFQQLIDTKEIVQLH